MTKGKRDQDWSRAVEADEAAAVKGGDGKTKGKGGKVPPDLMVVKMDDSLVSGT